MTEPRSAHTTLRACRAARYACVTRRADALFDLADALLTAEAVPSPVHLTLAPAHRRGWDSLYACPGWLARLAPACDTLGRPASGQSGG